MRRVRAAALVAAVAVAGCGGGDDEGPNRPDRAALPPEAVARVGDEVITKSAATHWEQAARVQAKGRCKPDGCRAQAMQFLISAEWLQLEAKRLGVAASPEEVERAFEKQKREAFPEEEDYLEWLEDSGRTEADLRFQVELSVLTQDVQAKATGRGEKKVRQQRLETFVAQFQKHYKGQTVCRRGYVAKQQCGKVVG